MIALSLIEHIKPQPAMCFDCGRFLLAASRSMCFSMTSQVAKSISFASALRCLPSITRRFARSCAICFCRRYSGDCLGYLRCCRLRLAIMLISLLCGPVLGVRFHQARSLNSILAIRENNGFGILRALSLCLICQIQIRSNL